MSLIEIPTKPAPKVLTSSRMKLYLQCERRQYNRFHLFVESETRSLALVMGSCLHKGLEEYWKTKTVVSPIGDKSVAMRAVKEEIVNTQMRDLFGEYACKVTEALVSKYCDVWKNDNLVALAVEKEFLLPMLDPMTGEQYNGWRISGKIDVIFKDLKSNQVFLMDHKTASSDISPGAPYWQKLHFDQQISMYYHASKRLGFDICGFIYDVLSKPKIEPKTRTPEDKIKLKKDGTPYAWVVEKDETPEEYLSRVMESMKGKEEALFARKCFTRSDCELEDFMESLCLVAKRLDGTSTEHDALKNTAACYAFGQTCPYFGACCGEDITSLPGLCVMEPFPELETKMEGK